MRTTRLEARAGLGVLCVLAFVSATSCARDPDDRRAILETAQRANYELARDTVVQLMRSPRDSGRVLYDAPTDLSARRAAATGAEQVWAPFGIAEPDTVAAGARSRMQTDSAAGASPTRPRSDTTATSFSRRPADAAA